MAFKSNDLIAAQPWFKSGLRTIREFDYDLAVVGREESMIDKSSQRPTSPWLSSNDERAHPSSPVGGGGPGKFIVPIAFGRDRNNSDPIAHPLSPNARSRALKPREIVALARAGIGKPVPGGSGGKGTGGNVSGVDISAQKRQILTSFGVDQMNNNPAGIGNECTHWIYAALFEARALDFDSKLHIQQTGVNYTWGRPVNTAAVQRGDIAQFHNFHNDFFIYWPVSGGGTRWFPLPKLRGPLHTGMVFVTPRSGMYFQLEAHLHQDPGETVMRVRGHTIYFESFAVAIPTTDFSSVKGSKAWPADIDPADEKEFQDRIDWAELRAKWSINLRVAATQFDRITHQKKNPTIDGKDVAVLFRVLTKGDVRFFCPQASAARLAMSPGELADEKKKLIKKMIKSGRTGGSPKDDQFGGDNKEQRIKDNRFDWTFAQP